VSDIDVPMMLCPTTTDQMAEAAEHRHAMMRTIMASVQVIMRSLRSEQNQHITTYINERIYSPQRQRTDYSTVTLVPPTSTMDVWRGIT